MYLGLDLPLTVSNITKVGRWSEFFSNRLPLIHVSIEFEKMLSTKEGLFPLTILVGSVMHGW